MRRLWLVLIALAVSCSGHRAVLPVPIMRYVFVESLPDETQLCVRRNPFVDDTVFERDWFGSGPDERFPLLVDVIGIDGEELEVVEMFAGSLGELRRSANEHVAARSLFLVSHQRGTELARGLHQRLDADEERVEFTNLLSVDEREKEVHRFRRGFG